VKRKITATAVLALGVALAVAPAVSATAGPTASAKASIVKVSSGKASSAKVSRATSAIAKEANYNGTENWTAYVLVGHTQGFRQVTADFKVPSVACTSASSKASFWIGLDGYGNGTVEQVGLSTNCSDGVPQYETWWEMYTGGPQYQFVVYPGETLSMFVEYVGGAWKLALTDLTRDTTLTKFNVTEKCPSGKVCENMTAEAVLEADAGGNLSKFSTTGFTEFQAVDSDYDTTGLVANGSVWGLAKLNMTGSNGANLADLSTITDDGEVFSLTYKQAN
jgi:hypothetical protein